LKSLLLDKFLLKQAEIKEEEKSNERRENGRQFKSHITTTLKNNTRTSHRRPKKFGRNNPS
jgi:hypothetical protein